ncbi:unnamed protein product [Symbiodinium sp. CCMP2592]|nr:unnamed protein product [Symbiodinium sp. CCMP2592]
MPPVATALFPHSKADKEAAVELLSECGGTWAYVQLVLDISSWLIVPCTAWSTTPWIFGLAFGPMVIMSLVQQQEKGHFQTFLSSALPVLMFLPSGQALLSKRALGALLRLACLLCCFLALRANDEQFGAHYGQDMHEDFHNSHALGCDFAQAPSWLQPCCASQQINLTTFFQCQEDLPWYRQTSCRTQAAAVCQAPGTRPTRIWIIFWPLLAILGLLPAQCCLYTWLGVQPNAGRTYEAAIRMVQESSKATRLRQIKLHCLILVWMLDLVSDFHTLCIFLFFHHYAFFSLGFLVFVGTRSVGSLTTLRLEYERSSSLGQTTDALRDILLPQKTVEAPVFLLLQYYASYYLCASGVYAMASVTLSSLLSLCTTADAAYGLLLVDPTARQIRERVHQLEALTEAGVDIHEHEPTTMVEI